VATVGLRELKAERTRAAIVAAALELFEAQGYDATRMEDVAAAAEVGTSTLYRYFPAKVDLLLAPVEDWNGTLAAGLRARPADEPLAASLRAIARAYLVEAEERSDLVARLQRLVESTPVARAGLWDVYAREHLDLAAAVAERSGRPATDPGVLLAAFETMAVINLCLEAWWGPAGLRPTETLAGVLATIDRTPHPLALT
jgi:AcrR family transcriptional regulator